MRTYHIASWNWRTWRTCSSRRMRLRWDDERTRCSERSRTTLPAGRRNCVIARLTTRQESDGDARGRPCEAHKGSEDPDLDGCIGTTACA